MRLELAKDAVFSLFTLFKIHLLIPLSMNPFKTTKVTKFISINPI